MSNKINKKEKIMSNKNIIIYFLVGVIVILGGILVFNNFQNKSSDNIQNILSSDIQNEISSNAQNQPLLPPSNIQNLSSPPPKLLVSEEKWDFGIVKPNDKPTHIFMIKNDGEGDLIIGELRVSCNRLETAISSSIIKPGESAELKVAFNTVFEGKTQKGTHPVDLHIYSNDPEVPNKKINLDINVVEL